MVGWYSDAHDAHKTKGLLYIHGLFFDIVHPSSFIQTNAVANNDRGQIVGHYGDSDLMLHGFLLSGHTYTTIEPPSAWWSVATGINNNGQIVGYYFTRADTRYRGFLYNSNNKTFAAIDYPSAEHTMPNGINNNGQIVGSYRNKYPNLENHGFLLSGGTYTGLDVP
jgi:probable HAF family extracellular repeat protein